METRTQERVEDWNARSFSGGFDGLRDLEADDFTGAVEAGGRWLFVLNGRIVGVFGGSIDDFEAASGTAYRAPDPGLVMLCTMWETGGDTRGEYYTNDTPIEEVDETLTSGGFTGYVELSENVLSGDYYVCYYGGRSLPVAFVGNSEQLLTGDEAFDRANDEVGIYEVRTVDISVVDLPEPDSEEEEDDAETVADASAAAGATDAGESDDDGESSTPPGDDSTTTTTGNGGSSAASREDATTSEPDSDPDPHDDVDDGPAVTADIRREEDPTSDDDVNATPDDVVAAPPPDSDRPDAGDGSSTDDPDARRDRSNGGGSRSASGGEARSSSGGRGRSERRERSTETGSPRNGSAGSGGSDPIAGSAAETGRAKPDRNDPRFEREEEWREATTIPSIDPENSASPDEPPARNAANGGAVGRSAEGTVDRQDSNGRSRTRSGSTRNAASSRGGNGEPLEREMLEREDKIDRLQQRLSDLETERDELRAEADRLRAEAESGGDTAELEAENERLESENGQLRDHVDSLESEVDRLEREVERLQSELEDARTSEPAEPDRPSGQQLTPARAMSGTNLFVRYDSKGEDTLADAHSGTATQSDVNGNLRLEHHTSFDADDVVVGDSAYETFLRESIEFGFVDWAVRTLLFEIRDTGNQNALRDLYDTLPEIDRAELEGSVELESDEEEEELPAEIAFDVVLRNRMGAPLVVANINDSRDPATEGMMVGLNEDANAVRERHDEFVGAFMVTTSFFSPGALETADEATSGSLLSRDSRKSFVKLSRKQGYHLSLVETRDGNFHVNVPEL